jgi:hypothetical protein
MKLQALILSVLIVTSFVFSGCTKTSDGATVAMTATVGSHSFSAVGASVTAKISNGQLGITGISLALESIALSIDTTVASIGTLPIDNKHAFCAYASKPGAIAAGLSGSITFTAVSPNLVGTFSVVCNDSTQITNGAFTVQAP